MVMKLKNKIGKKQLFIAKLICILLVYIWLADSYIYIWKFGCRPIGLGFGTIWVLVLMIVMITELNKLMRPMTNRIAVFLLDCIIILSLFLPVYLQREYYFTMIQSMTDSFKITFRNILGCIPVIVAYILSIMLLIDFIKSEEKTTRIWAGVGVLLLLALTIVYNHVVMAAISRSKFFCKVLDVLIIVSITVILLNGNDKSILPYWFHHL